MQQPKPVVQPNEFPFAVTDLEHGHIFMQTQGLLDAGAKLKWVFDSNPEKRSAFVEKFQHTGVKAASCLDEILDDQEVKLVAAAAIPNERGPLGCKVMQAGKDYFTDKCPFTSLEQLEEARAVCSQTEMKYAVFYSERVDVESAYVADEIIKSGAIGDIVHINIMGPHRLGQGPRPDWFYKKACYGGILTDICSHQVDQFLHYTGSTGGEVSHARVDNFAHPDTPELEDFGEAIFKMSSGASCHSRVDWFTPDGLQTWGDGRMFAVGTKGYLEVRKYIDIANSTTTDRIYLVDQQKEQMIDCLGKTGKPYYGQLILDCLNRTENAMTQHHAFMASELSLKAQLLADRNRA